MSAAHEEICWCKDPALTSLDGAFLDEASEGSYTAAGIDHNDWGVFDIFRTTEIRAPGPNSDVDTVALLEFG